MLPKYCFAALLHLVSMSAPCDAQARQIQLQAVKYSWAPHPTQPGEWVLTACDGTSCRHVGNYKESTKTYRSYANGVWGPPDCAPCGLPEEVVARQKPRPESKEPPKAEPRLIGDTKANYGIIIEEVPQGVSYRICNGKLCRDVNREQAFEAIANGFPDDSGKPSLTIIGGTEACATVKNDLTANDGLRKAVEGWAVQILPPTSPLVKGLGFQDGAPSIYMQDTNGKVLHRQAEYRGPDQLAEAARKADPKYDPKLDPDVTKPQPAPAGPKLNLATVPGWVWIIGVAAGVFLLFPTKKATA